MAKLQVSLREQSEVFRPKGERAEVNVFTDVLKNISQTENRFILGRSKQNKQQEVRGLNPS